MEKLGVKGKVRKIVLFLIPRIIAVLLGLAIYGVIYPSIIPAASIESGQFIPSPFLWAAVVALPVMFVLQTWYRSLRLAGWLLLCLFIALLVAG